MPMMAPMEELLKRIAEDRRIAERELLQSRIRSAFDSARAQPVDTPHTQSEHEVICEMVVEVPVTARPLRPLVDRASPLLEKLAKTPMLRRRPDRDTWTIDEIPTEAPEELFDEALTSLGYSAGSNESKPVTQEIAPRKKWWQK
jgi:hypothetical protein